MKKEKMSLEKMKGVLSHVLSREEMKEVMAGSGGGNTNVCGFCWDYQRAIGGYCYPNSASNCTCSVNGWSC